MKPNDAAAAGGGDQPAVVFTDRAAHLTDAFNGMVRRCAYAVSRDRGLHHVAHYSAGVYDFAVDVLDAPGLATRQPEPVDRRLYTDVGRRLSFKVSSLDRTLEEMRSGRLIRMVLHTESGVVYCNSMTPGEDLIALMFGGAAASDQPLSAIPAVREADRAAAELVTELRRDVGLTSQNPGGWRPLSQDWLTEKPADPMETTTPIVAPGVVDVHQHGTGDAITVTTCRYALSPDELVYLAYYQDDGDSFAVDLLSHQLTGRYFTHISPEARRKFYAQFGRQFAVLVRQLRQLTRPLFTGRLRRVVLDIEQGAIYYYRLDSGRYLVGVTLNQDRVSYADDRMSGLAVELSG